jgi:hypothetical protein
MNANVARLPWEIELQGCMCTCALHCKNHCEVACCGESAGWCLCWCHAPEYRELRKVNKS